LCISYFTELRWKDESEHKKNIRIEIQDGQFIYLKLPEFVAYPPGSVSVIWSMDTPIRSISQNNLTLTKNLFYQIIKEDSNVTNIQAFIEQKLSNTTLLSKWTLNVEGNESFSISFSEVVFK